MNKEGTITLKQNRDLTENTSGVVKCVHLSIGKKNFRPSKKIQIKVGYLTTAH